MSENGQCTSGTDREGGQDECNLCRLDYLVEVLADYSETLYRDEVNYCPNCGRSLDADTDRSGGVEQ